MRGESVGIADFEADGYGVPKDVVESYAWWNLASTEMERAVRARDDLERLMSPAQVAAAQKRARKLKSRLGGH